MEEGGIRGKRMSTQGLQRHLLKVQRASGKHRPEKRLDALACRLAHLTCPNKAVELGWKQFREDEVLNRCLCWLSTCVYFSVCLYWPHMLLQWKRAPLVLFKSSLNICVFVCLVLWRHVWGESSVVQSRQPEWHLSVEVFNICWLSMGNCCHGDCMPPCQAKSFPVGTIFSCKEV